MTTGYDDDLPPDAREAISAADAELREMASATEVEIASIEAEARARVERMRAALGERQRERRAALAATLKPLQEAVMRAGDLDAALAIREHVRRNAGPAAGAAQPAPTNLVAFASEGLGKTYAFDVVGLAQGPVWGTDEYTLDSHLAVAAVHAGVVRPGERRTVRVTLFDTAGKSFTGTLRNGVQSFNWTSYPVAYRFV